MKRVLFVEMRVGGRCGTSSFSEGICALLREMGVEWFAVDGEMNPAKIAAMIREREVSLVLSCPRMGSIGVLPCVPQFPEVTFGYRTLCNANLMSYHHEWSLLCGFAELAKTYRNAWLLPNNEQIAMVFGKLAPSKTKLFPNYYAHEPVPMPTRAHEDIRIGIAGRACVSKNMGATAVACMILKRRLPKAHVFVWSPITTPPSAAQHIGAFCQLGSAVTFMPWTHDFRSMIQGVGIDIALCPSTTESFGFIQTDFMSLGIPVVGSHAVTHLPPAFQVGDESDPVAIADLALAILNELPLAQQLAIDSVATTREHNRQVTCETLTSLLS